MSERIKTNNDRINPSYGAYSSDYARGIVELDENENPPDKDDLLLKRGDGTIGFHDKGLYDEEDTRIPDESDGKVQEQPNELDELELEVVDEAVDPSSTVYPDQAGLDKLMGMDDDDAAKWLEANS